MMTIVNAAARLSACVVTMTATATAIGPCGARYLGTGTAEDSSEEPDRYSAVEPGDCSQTRRYAECQGDGQPDHGSRNAAKDVAAEGLEVVVDLGEHSMTYWIKGPK